MNIDKIAEQLAEVLANYNKYLIASGFDAEQARGLCFGAQSKFIDLLAKD